MLKQIGTLMTRAVCFRFVFIGLALLLNACSEYEIKFNDRQVYNPKPLFSDYHIPDQALKECVRQTIKDQRATRVEHVTRLVCTNAGITSLEGLAALAHLEQVNLAHNLIEDVSSLTNLSNLRQLDVSHNALEHVVDLATLAQLERVALEGNSALDCNDADQLARNSDATVELPEHCQ